jgi:hypothetical protein
VRDVTRPWRRLCLLAALLALVAQACGGGRSSPVAPSPAPGAGAVPPAVTGGPQLGRDGYVEFVPGTAPLVISVPHGGALAPADIPNRSGTTTTDLNTIELGRAMVAAVQARSGRAPHIVICHLRRTKLDANRDLADAAQGNAAAAQAWHEYHGFIETASRAVVATHGRGFYVDLHGHGHAIPRVELGYLLDAGDLARSDGELDRGHAGLSSLRALAASVDLPFSALLRGPTSLGGLLEARRVPSVPSPGVPSPGADPYFSGGYSTDRHARDPMSGVQVEVHYAGARDSEAARQSFATAFADALAAFFDAHYRAPL